MPRAWQAGLFAVPGPIEDCSIDSNSRLGSVVTTHLRRKAPQALFDLDRPTRVAVCRALGAALSVDQKGHPVAHLRDGRMRTKIPNCGCKHILAGAKERAKIVRLISPVAEVASAGTATHTPLIYMEDELVIRAHVHIKVLGRCREFDDLSEVEHDFIPLRGTWGGNPLRFPRTGMISRKLCTDLRGAGEKSWNQSKKDG